MKKTALFLGLTLTALSVACGGVAKKVDPTPEPPKPDQVPPPIFQIDPRYDISAPKAAKIDYSFKGETAGFLKVQVVLPETKEAHSLAEFRMFTPAADKAAGQGTFAEILDLGLLSGGAAKPVADYLENADQPVELELNGDKKVSLKKAETAEGLSGALTDLAPSKAVSVKLTSGNIKADFKPEEKSIAVPVAYLANQEIKADAVPSDGDFVNPLVIDTDTSKGNLFLWAPMASATFPANTECRLEATITAAADTKKSYILVINGLLPNQAVSVDKIVAEAKAKKIPNGNGAFGIVCQATEVKETSAFGMGKVPVYVGLSGTTASGSKIELKGAAGQPTKPVEEKKPAK